MKKKLLALLCTILLLALQTRYTFGTGSFYVGLLGYNNTAGIRCCSEDVDETMCQTECKILFEVRVSGLNGTQQSKNLSNVQLTLAEAITIPTNLVTNPLSFYFNGWPGEVNVSVVVSAKYGNGDFKQFDYFHHTFQSNGPIDFYYNSNVDSDNFSEGSQLSIVFRYECDKRSGSGCWDCLDHNDTNPCPLAGPAPSSQSITVPRCNIDNSGNCSVNVTTIASEITTPLDELTTPTDESTTPSDGLFETTEAETSSVSSTITMTSPLKYQDSNSNISQQQVTSSYTEIPTSELNTQHLTTSSKVSDTKMTTISVNQSLTTKLSFPSSAGPNNVNISILTQKVDISKSTVGKVPSTVTLKDERTTRLSRDVSTTTPSEVVTKIDDGPTYWPAIVGGVLGGIAFMSAVGFCIYYRRQKKLRKRQEIYNVNPKVLRNFEEYEENGTSGRADVPLETEQY